jgi:phage gp29-like protein
MSFLTPKLAEDFRASRYNPVEGFTPQSAVAWRGNFRRGYLRPWSLFWRELEEGADMRLAAIVPKRRAGAAVRDWDIIVKQDTPEAHLHKEALQHFYTNIITRDAVELNREGGIKQLINDVADVVFLRYAAHEIVWKPRGADLTAELIRCPLEFLQNRSGAMAWAGVHGGLTNGPVLQPSDWLVSTHNGCLSMPLAVAWIYKQFSLKDWLNYNQGYAEPHIWGVTEASMDSKEWTQAEEAIQAIGTGARSLFAKGASIEALTLGTDGAGIFKPLYDLCDANQIVLVMGNDLSTLAAKDAVGASLQADDKDILVMSDLDVVSENLQRGLDRYVIRYVFGDNVKPLAEFRLLPPVRKDVKGIIEKQTHLRTMGIPISMTQAAEELDHSLPGDGEELISAATAPPTAPAEKPVAMENAEAPSVARIDTARREAVRADLLPLIQAIETALQDLSGAPLELDWTAIIDATLTNGGNLESALMRNAAEGFFTGLGMSPDEVSALIEQAITETETPSAPNYP